MNENVNNQTGTPENFVKLRTAQLKNLYRDEKSISNAFGKSSYGGVRLKTTKLTKSELENAVKDASSLSSLSEMLYATDATYADIVNYYASMYMYRYLITPIKLRLNNDYDLNDKEYLNMYNHMLSIAEGISLETVMPKLITDIYVHGAVALYVSKNNKNDTVETLFLPRKYCRTAFKTEFNTDVIQFDFSYFTELRRKLTDGKDESFNELMSSFPKEFAIKYSAYVSGGSKWQQLDSRFATMVSLNDAGTPPKVLASNGIIDYEKIKENEITRSTNDLVNILTHQIPNHEGQLMFEIDELSEIQRGMADAVKNEKGFKVLTTFGTTNLLSLKTSRTSESNPRYEAYQSVFTDASVNPEIFVGTKEASLDASLKKDEAQVWLLIERIIKFYNLAINNLYNFKPYQMQLKMLPLTVYNYSKMMETMRTNATFGIGKLEAIVASGVKQVEIQDRHRLETAIGLDSILTPLQSSHTQNTVSSSNEEKKTNTDVEDEKPVDETVRGEDNE